MSRISSGILLYRIKNEKLQIYLVHPGGPYFSKKDYGHWGIPKGEVDEEEDLLGCAIREVEEETGLKITGNDFLPLGSIIQKGGKKVYAFAHRHDDDINLDNSASMIEIEFPYNSGKKIKIPEVDKGEFFITEEARRKIKETQIDFIDRLENILKTL